MFTLAPGASAGVSSEFQLAFIFPKNPRKSVPSAKSAFYFFKLLYTLRYLGTVIPSKSAGTLSARFISPNTTAEFRLSGASEE
jgi:hypothetical protein